MFGWLTRSKKGFTLVELMIVIVLICLGAVALINLFQVANRSFDKSEERYRKQEAVKMAAELLRTGSANVAAAQTADIFEDVGIVPTGEAIDEGYSYLFTQPVNECVECGEPVDFKSDKCSCGGTAEFAGYFLYNLNKGQKRSVAQQVSDVPMYVSMRPYEDYSYEGAPKAENQGGVIITIAALEDDFEYEFDSSGKLTKDPQVADGGDYIYYSLEVAYHFPNMVTSGNGVTVNYITSSQLSSANTYADNGNINGTVYAKECATDSSVASGDITKFNYRKCSDTSDEHGGGCSCTKDNKEHFCKDCDCICTGKTGYVLRIYADSILSGDNTNTSVAVPKLCFIATASYGHDSGEVGLLCDFRDNVLLKSELGTAFVKTYYKLSPPVAEIISEHEGLKAAVRIALKPLVTVAQYALDEEIRSEGAIFLAMFMLCGASATAVLVSIDKRRKKADK